MDKYTGVDVSKEKLDVAFFEGGKWQWLQVSNGPKGFKRLIRALPPGTTVAMEASGPYYLPLATHLHGQGIGVCVVNPLQVRRYAQMKMYRAKTDRKDARVIAEYAHSETPKRWEPSETAILQLQQLLTAIDGLHRQMNIAMRQLEAFTASGMVDPQVKKSLNRTLANGKKELAALEARAEKLAAEEYGQTTELLRSIPGIGAKAATILTVITNNFGRFDNHKQLIAYVGFSPRIYQSGTSVNGKGHICKMGNPQVRKILYMCTWTAKTCNPGCQQMYERLKAKGKPERVIKIALANKLLKQAFAVATKKEPFDKNYSLNTCF